MRSKTFFVKQNSTLSEIKFPLTERLMEQFDITEDMMDDVAITFSMVNVENGRYQVANEEGRLDIIDNVYERLDDDKYTLVYRLNLLNTYSSGVFIGEFKLDFLGENCGKITFPVETELKIVINDSLTKTSVNPIAVLPVVFDDTFDDSFQ
jgi:hypothetical protein